MKKILGVDIGLDGGISDGTHFSPMPTIVIEDKPARYVLDLDSKGRKQYIKSGPNKGQVKKKLKTKAKTHRELDIIDIGDIFRGYEVLVIESPAMSFGNSAKTTATTNRNYGKLLGIAELLGLKIVSVPPHQWKKDLGLSTNKLESVELAEQLSGKSFRSERRALQDGPAEAYLIRHWYIKHKLKENND